MHGDLFHHNLFIVREKSRGTLKSEIIRVNLNAYSLRAVRVQKYIVTLKKVDRKAPKQEGWTFSNLFMAVLQKL